MDAAHAELNRRMRAEGIPLTEDAKFYFPPNCCSVETARHGMLARIVAGNTYATHYIVTLRTRNIPGHLGHIAKYSINSCGVVTETL